MVLVKVIIVYPCGLKEYETIIYISQKNKYRLSKRSKSVRKEKLMKVREKEGVKIEKMKEDVHK